MKAILLIIVVLLIYWVFWGRQRGGSGGAATDRSAPPASPEKMVVCAHCKLHVPESECVSADGRHYCCEEHRQLGAS